MDEFTIHIPRERPFATVVGLVVGGIAARHEVTLDVLDDLQLALDGMLERTDDDHEGQLTIELRVEGGTIAASIGPVTASTAAELEEDAGDVTRPAPPARNGRRQRRAQPSGTAANGSSCTRATSSRGAS